MLFIILALIVIVILAANVKVVPQAYAMVSGRTF